MALLPPIKLLPKERVSYEKVFAHDWLFTPETEYDKNKYNILNSYQGLWYLANHGKNMILCEAGNSEEYTVIENPKIITYEESSLQNANIIRQTSGGGRYFIGKAVVAPTHNYSTGTAPVLSKFHNFLINHEESLSPYYQTINPNNLYFDIETTGLKPSDQIVLSIGCILNHHRVAMIDFMGLLDHKELSNVQYAPKDRNMLAAEKYMLQTFLKAVELADPDTLIGYYSWGFDIPFIINRALTHKLYTELTSLFRFPFLFTDPTLPFDHTNPESQRNIKNHLDYLADMNKNTPDNKHFDFAGRIHLDIHHHFVERDLSVKPPKNMKSVGKFYKLDQEFPIFDDIGRNNMWKEYTERLPEARMYLSSDLLLTRGEHLIYAPRIKRLLDNTPYSMSGFSIAKKTSNLGYKYGRQLLEKGYIIGSAPRNQSPSMIIVQQKYEGAITGKQSIGWKDKSYKRDVISYYPNIMISFNLGLTNTAIDKIRPYTGQSEFISNPNKPYNHFICPDVNNKVDYRIRIYKESCPVLDELTDMFNLRIEAKIAAGNAKKNKDMVTYYLKDGDQQSIKTDINSSYGLAGNQQGMGNMPTAISVVGFSKVIINNLIHAVVMTTGDRTLIAEVDTDGIFFTKEIELASINDFIDDFVRATGIAVKSTIELEDEDFDLTVIKAIKNYSYKQDGVVKTKGSSLNSKNMSSIVEYVRDELFKKNQMSGDASLIVPQHIFDSNVKDIIYNVKVNGYDKYVKTVNINKPLANYQPSNHIRKLGEQWEIINKTKIRNGTTLHYIQVQQEPFILLYEGQNIIDLQNDMYTVNCAKYYQEYASTQRMG